MDQVVKKEQGRFRTLGTVFETRSTTSRRSSKSEAVAWAGQLPVPMPVTKAVSRVCLPLDIGPGVPRTAQPMAEPPGG